MPIDFYRVLGAETHFLGDGIRRAYEARVSKPPQYGYSEEVLIGRREILRGACETLSDPRSRREYNQGLAEDEFDTILTEVPWDKVVFEYFVSAMVIDFRTHFFNHTPIFSSEFTNFNLPFV